MVNDASEGGPASERSAGAESSKSSFSPAVVGGAVGGLLLLALLAVILLSYRRKNRVTKTVAPVHGYGASGAASGKAAEPDYLQPQPFAEDNDYLQPVAGEPRYADAQAAAHFYAAVGPGSAAAAKGGRTAAVGYSRVPVQSGGVVYDVPLAPDAGAAYDTARAAGATASHYDVASDSAAGRGDPAYYAVHPGAAGHYDNMNQFGFDEETENAYATAAASAGAGMPGSVEYDVAAGHDADRLYEFAGSPSDTLA